MPKKCCLFGKQCFFQTSTFLTQFRKQIRFFKTWYLESKSVLCLFGRLGRHEARQQKRLGEKESFAPKFLQGSLLHDASQHKCIYWGIVAGTHMELIEWLNALSNLWHGFAAVSMGELGHSIFLSTMAPKKKTRKLAAQTRNLRNKRGNSRNGVKCVFLFWIALLRASGHLLALTCCVYTSRVLHQLCFIRSWLSSSFTTDMMAIWVQTLVSSNSVRTKIALHI